MQAGDKLTLREARFEDAFLLWEWRNEESVRRVSFDSEPIVFEKHAAWLTRKLADTQSKIYIFECQEKPIAQVRFDGNVENNTANISIIVDVSARGFGWGGRIIRLAVQTYQEQFLQRTIIAFIKPENQASIRAFENAGFSLEDQTETLTFRFESKQPK